MGVEVDVERYNHFFKDAKLDRVPSSCVPPACADIDTDAMSFMGNMVAPFGNPAATWRPYGTVGVGVIHSSFDGPRDAFDSEQNDLAFNAGGGVMYSINGRVAIRGDLRYFRALVGEHGPAAGYRQDYGFLRVGVGVSFRF